MAKTKDKVEEKEKKVMVEEKDNKAKEKETVKKSKSATLSIDSRGEVETYFFPPEIVQLRKLNDKWGYLISGHEMNGLDVKVFVPQNDNNIESKQLKYSKTNPNWVVASMPKGSKLQSYIYVDVEQKKEEDKDRLLDRNEYVDEKKFAQIDNRNVEFYTNDKFFNQERPDRQSDDYEKEVKEAIFGKKQRLQEYVQVSTVVLDKIQKKYARYQDKTKDNAKEEVSKEVPAKETESKDASANVAVATDKKEDKDNKPIFITAEAKELNVLRGGKGYFLDFKHNDDNLCIFIPRKAEGITAERKSSWLMIKVDKDYKFYLYRPDTKGNYEKMENFVGVDLVRSRSWKINKAYEKNNNNNKENANSNSR